MSNETRRNKAQPIANEAQYAALQWANGRTEYRGAKGRMTSLVGWHVEVGKSAAFDALAEAKSLPQVEIKHMGKTELTAHWYLDEEVSVYPLTFGPLADTMQGATKISDRMADEAGIVASWIERSYLGCLVLVSVEGDICEEPLVLSAKSTLTPHLYGALLAHLRMCEAADAVAGQTVPCPWIALPLTAGEAFDAGRSETTTITPMRANYERAPENVDIGYLKAISLPRELRSFAQELSETGLTWARETLDKQREGDERTVAQRAVVKV